MQTYARERKLKQPCKLCVNKLLARGSRVCILRAQIKSLHLPRLMPIYSRYFFYVVNFGTTPTEKMPALHHHGSDIVWCITLRSGKPHFPDWNFEKVLVAGFPSEVPIKFYVWLRSLGLVKGFDLKKTLNYDQVQLSLFLILFGEAFSSVATYWNAVDEMSPIDLLLHLAKIKNQ